MNAPTPPAAPAARAPRLCACGCRGVLTERSRQGKLRKYLSRGLRMAVKSRKGRS